MPTSILNHSSLKIREIFKRAEVTIIQEQAEAELCQAQVKLEVMFDAEMDVGVEVVVRGTLKLWL